MSKNKFQFEPENPQPEPVEPIEVVPPEILAIKKDLPKSFDESQSIAESKLEPVKEEERKETPHEEYRRLCRESLGYKRLGKVPLQPGLKERIEEVKKKCKDSEFTDLLGEKHE